VAARGLSSFHGPTARAELTEFSRASFVRTVLDGVDATGSMPDAQTLRAGKANGRLAGGNLALVASLCGTPWAIDFRDAIVVLEDINEATYRLDRMLLQLRMAGAFDGCVGLMFGQFTDCPPESDDGARSLNAVMQECADLLGVPAVLGAPIGHVADQWTLPLGALATLDASTCTLTVHGADR
jgi:muramoyltetrapeptide carboxypeptidase